MARCELCDCELPGSERICRRCYEAQYNPDGSRRTWEQRLRRFVRSFPVTSVLTGLCVVVFFAMLIDTFGEDTDVTTLIRWGADFPPLTRSGQWWRLLTSMFIHGGYLHLLFNMGCLTSLGPVAERAFGRATFLVTYLVTGVIGGLIGESFHPAVPSVGASGAIFGIAGLLLAWRLVDRAVARRHRAWLPLKSLLLFAGVNLAIGAVIPFINNAAHIGGLVSGMVIGVVLAMARPPETVVEPSSE